MSEQTDNIVKQLKKDAKESRKGFVDDVVIAVQSVIDENMQNQKFVDAVNLLQTKSESLDKIESIETNVIQLQSVATKTEVEEIKNNISSSQEGIELIKGSITNVNNTIEAININEQHLSEKLGVIDELAKKENTDEIQSLLSTVQAGVDSGCTKTDEVIKKFDELKTVAQAEDVKKIIEVTEESKNTLSTICDNISNQSDKIDGISSDTKNILANIEVILQNVSAETVAEISDKLNNQILSLTRILEANNSLVEKVEHIQTQLDNAELVEMANSINSNKDCLEKIEEKTNILFDESEQMSFAALKNEFKNKIKLIYLMNAFTIGGLILIIVLLFVK